MNELLPPSLDEIERMASAAFDALPPPVRQACAGVGFRVVDLADDAMLADLELEDPYELTGLYDGIPLTEKSVMDQAAGPDTVWLFRLAILDEWIVRGDVGLDRLVAHILVHELAHHLGWSDDDIAAVDPWWE